MSCTTPEEIQGGIMMRAITRSNIGIIAADAKTKRIQKALAGTGFKIFTASPQRDSVDSIAAEFTDAESDALPGLLFVDSRGLDVFEALNSVDKYLADVIFIMNGECPLPTCYPINADGKPYCEKAQAFIDNPGVNRVVSLKYTDQEIRSIAVDQATYR